MKPGMSSWDSLLAADARWSGRFRVAEKPGPLRTAAMIFAHSGDSWFWGAALLALIWQARTLTWKQWALVELVWISLLAALVMAIKFTVRRRRPEGEWGAIYRNTDPHSFPSGHAARAFLIAVIAAGLGPGWLAGLLWVWAPLVSLARVAMGVHYLSDILAGILLGVVVGLVGLQTVDGLLALAAGWLSFP